VNQEQIDDVFFHGFGFLFVNELMNYIKNPQAILQAWGDYISMILQ